MEQMFYSSSGWEAWGEVVELTEFKQRALSQIAAQHLEIERLREQLRAGGNVSSLPKRRPTSGTIGSCS